MAREHMFDTVRRRYDTYPEAMPDAPKKPEPTPFEKFEDAARRIFQVPKKEADKAALRERKAREAREAERQK